LNTLHLRRQKRDFGSVAQISATLRRASHGKRLTLQTKEKPMMTTMLFNSGMIFFVPQLFIIGLWAMGKIMALTDYPSSGWHSAPLTESP
jgi:hypothetical protein